MNKLVFLFSTLSIILILDQGSKIYIDTYLPLYHSIEVVPNFFHITHIRNTGVAFGMFAAEKSIGLTVFFLIISGTAIGIIIYLYFFSSPNLLKQSALILILGGAAGNLIDRVRLQEVIDFIDLHWYQYHWPAFNIADTCITIGVGLFIWDSLFTRDK